MNYLPRTVCLQGDPLLIGLHVGADILICLSYLLIPVAAMLVVMRALNSAEYREFIKRNVWQFTSLPLAFTLASGALYAVDAVTFTYTIYWAEAIWELLTAALGLATAIMFGGLGIHDPAS